MNLSQLYYFRKLAQIQHYTKAAQELYIAQSSLSDSISALEKDLGVALFQKRGRTVVLTKYGTVFYPYVCAALNDLEKGVAIVKENANLLSGTVDIGCIPTILGDFLPDVLNDYIARKGQQIKFNVYDAMTQEIIAGIKSSRFDVGFCSFVEKEPELYFSPVMTQELILAVNPSHPFANNSELSLNDLKKHHLLSYRPDLPIGNHVKKLLQPYHLDVDYAYDDEIILYGIVSKQPVAAVVLRTPSIKQFGDVTPIHLREVPADFRLVHMVFSTKNYKSRAVESFIDFVAAFKSSVPRFANKETSDR